MRRRPRQFHATAAVAAGKVMTMRRVLPVLPLLVLIALGVWLTHDLGWQTLARHQARLLGWVAAHPVLAPGVFVLAYAATTALSLPQASLLTAIGGLLFGPLLAAPLAAVGAAAGGALLLVMLRATLADPLARQRARIPATMRARLERDGLYYLLFVRLLPVFPFWLVNLAAAVTDLTLRDFVLGTLIGVLPLSFAIASIGAGIGDVLAAGRTPDMTAVFAPRILLPLLALAVLSLLPLLLRRWSRHG